MEFPYLVIQIGIVMVQSCCCCMYGCRTSDKIDELERKLQKLTNETAFYLKRIMARNDGYRPPHLDIAPAASAPPLSDPIAYSQPEVYKLDNIY